MSNNKSVLNNLWETNPEIAKLLVNSEDGLIYSKESKSKVSWKCSDCGYINQKRVDRLVVNSNCKKCSDKLSLGEKIVYHLINYKNMDFKHEVSFKWSQKKRYDFYIPTLDCIVEVHGEQHYIQTNRKGGRSLKEEQDNDQLKKDLALANGIKEYIIIDARKSDSRWVIKNILESKLRHLLDIEESDFLKINFKPNLITLRAWKLWSEGNGVMKIADELKISKKAVRGRLILGNSLGKCDYKTENRYDGIKKSIIKLDLVGSYINSFESLIDAKCGNPKKSLQLTVYPFDIIRKTDEFIWVYEEEYNTDKQLLMDKLSAFNTENLIHQLDKNLNLISTHKNSIDASQKTGLDYFGIRSAMDNDSKTYKGFIWLTNKRYNDFKMKRITKDSLNQKKYRTRKVVKLSIDYEQLCVYKSISEAARENNGCAQSHISKCCRKDRKSCGGFIWRYADDLEQFDIAI